MSKKVLIIVTVLLSVCYVNAQQTFSGRVVDEQNNPIEFANVALLSLPDSAWIGGTTTNETGSFSFKIATQANDYFLKISFLGYLPALIVLDKNSSSNIGDITLQVDSKQLQEINVIGQTPKITFSNGKFTADIEHSIAAQGNSLESLLNQLPGVWASSNGISAFGNAVTVYVNNREVRLQGEPLMQYLRSLRSEEISKIEIMQNASAEFSAEGAGGIIRIITKRIADDGWKGTISPAITFQDYFGFSPYASLQYGKGKFGAMLSLNGEISKWLLHSDNNSQDFVNKTHYNTLGTDTIFNHNYSASLTLNYDFNRYNKLVFYTYYMYWGKEEHINTMTDILGNLTDDIANTQTQQQTKQNMNAYSFTINYDLLLDTLGKNKFTLLADYVNQYKYNTKDYLHYLNNDSTGGVISDENLLNDQNKPYQIYSAEVRFQHSLGKFGSGLTGIKYGYSSVYSDFSNYEQILNDWQLQPTIGYNYQYDEQLFSGFYQYNLERTKWSLLAGLRGEYTNGKGKYLGKNLTRFDLFPTLSYSYNFNGHHSLNLLYTRRINRISYFTLIPQRYYLSRYTVFEGNPALTPNILNTIALNYNINQTYYFTASYKWSNNALSRYNNTSIINNQTVIVSTYSDGVISRSFNFNAYIPLKFTSWWSSTNQADLYVDSYKTHINQFSNFNYSLFTQHDFILPYKIKGQILYRYFSPSKSAYTQSYQYHLLNASLQKSFSDFFVKIEANQLIFNKGGEETTTEQTFVQNYLYGKNPMFKLTLSYSFSAGKTKEIQRAKNSNQQETSRAW